MPIYEYKCPQCRAVFEEWVKAADAHGQEPCPKCGASSPRVMSQTSFVLKGGGWYVSDYGYRKGIKDEEMAPPANTPAATSGAAPAAKAAADTPQANGKKAPAGKDAAKSAGPAGSTGPGKSTSSTGSAKSAGQKAGSAKSAPAAS